MKFSHLCLLFILLGIFIVPQEAAASDAYLEDAVNHQFKDKVLVLLHPREEELLRFDVDGKPLDAKPLRPWTTFGGVRITKMQLRANQLRLEGRRVFFLFNSDRLVPYEFKPLKNRINPPCQPLVEIEIKLDKPLNSLDEAKTVLGKVFAFNKQDFLDSVPMYWRGYLSRVLEFDPTRPGELRYKAEDLAKTADLVNGTGKAATIEEGGSIIFKVGKDVKPPKARFTPEPDFSEAARYEKFKGTAVIYVVVDKAGNVAQLKVVRPLGLGLDDQAAIRMKDWRFDPALHNGEPVAVAMNVEVRFDLY